MIKEYKCINCQIEGCKGKASGNLKIVDKETLKELDVCVTCYCGIEEVECQKNNCGNQAIDKDFSGDFVCEEHDTFDCQDGGNKLSDYVK